MIAVMLESLDFLSFSSPFSRKIRNPSSILIGSGFLAVPASEDFVRFVLVFDMTLHPF